MSSKRRIRSSSGPSPSLSDIECTAARYLFAISGLSADRGHRTGTSSDDRIRTGELQDRLGVTPASVTEMVSKLDERGLVEYEKYQGVRLETRGERLATRLEWRFCIVTSFFESVLETTLDDRTAFEIGYVLPEKGIFRLRELVGSPCHELCPESRRGVECCVA